MANNKLNSFAPVNSKYIVGAQLIFACDEGLLITQLIVLENAF